MYKPKHLIVAAALLVGAAIPVAAQQPAAPPPPPTTPYGSPIGLEAAKKAMAAAEAEAVKNNWPMAIVILDSTGHIVMLHRLDNTQYGSIRVAEDKAIPRSISGGRVRSLKIWWRRAALACVRSAFAERPHLRVASQLLPTARSLEPSVSRARPLSRMDRLPRLAPILPRPSRSPVPTGAEAAKEARFGHHLDFASPSMSNHCDGPTLG
jgi:hypothetical protein